MTETKRTDTALVPRAEHDVMQELEGGGSFTPSTLRDVLDFGRMMSGAGSMVPSFCQDNPGACCAITLRALRWGMDPFAVAEKSYEVETRKNGRKIAYEAQLVHAVINTRAGLEDDLEVSYEGEGTDRRVIVKGVLRRGKRRVLEYKSPPLSKIAVKNSPLWTADLDQQFHYYGVRAWGRRFVPEVLLGVYTRDEIQYGEVSAETDKAQVIEHKPRTDVLDDDAIADPDEPIATAPLGARMSFKLEKCTTEDELKACYLLFQAELDAIGKKDREPLRDLYAAHLQRVTGMADAEKVMAWSKTFRMPAESAA